MTLNKVNQIWYDTKIKEKVLTYYQYYTHRMTNSSISTARKLEEKLNVVVQPYICHDHWYRWYVTSKGTRLYLEFELTTSKIKSGKIELEIMNIKGDDWLVIKESTNQMEFDF